MPAVGQCLAHLFKAGELLGRERVVGLVGDGEMSPKPGIAELGRGDDRFDKSDGLLRRGSDSVHAGVNLDLDLDAASSACCRPAQGLEAAWRVDGREQITGHYLRHGLPGGFREDTDRDFETGLAQHHALFD